MKTLAHAAVRNLFMFFFVCYFNSHENRIPQSLLCHPCALALLEDRGNWMSRVQAVALLNKRSGEKNKTKKWIFIFLPSQKSHCAFAYQSLCEGHGQTMSCRQISIQMHLWLHAVITSKIFLSSVLSWWRWGRCRRGCRGSARLGPGRLQSYSALKARHTP